MGEQQTTNKSAIIRDICGSKTTNPNKKSAKISDICGNYQKKII